MLKIDDTWDPVRELKGELDERNGMPHRSRESWGITTSRPGSIRSSRSNVAR